MILEFKWWEEDVALLMIILHWRICSSCLLKLKFCESKNPISQRKYTSTNQHIKIPIKLKTMIANLLLPID
jgi:hypothetical protein